jgi:hypothetical protein
MKTLNIARKIRNTSSYAKLLISFEQFSGNEFLGEKVVDFTYEATSFGVVFTDGSVLVSNQKGFIVR